MAPGVSAVKGHIDRNIADDPDPLSVGIIFQLLPLCREQILKKFVESYLFVKHCSVVVHGVLFTESDILGPYHKHQAVIMLFHGAEQGKIREPVAVFNPEILKFFPQTVIFVLCPFPAGMQAEGAVGVCSAKKRVAASVYLLIINRAGFFAKIEPLGAFPVYISGLDQGLRINKIRISGKGRKGLVGRIPVPRLSERKDLPVCLAGFLKKINKFICFFGKASNPVGGRKACYREQHPASSVHRSNPSYKHFTAAPVRDRHDTRQ